ncbi:Corticosteroid-binding protein [Pleurostoma richardsiae]|uniref:Corticosteroid-binding protein n=1 Tax=Pleurostoma richardsiae TaxID=41990 RepID=A0AA38RAH4_9PEZI|nr:Corticosteroid-binding protein [Pleurostoma richardsiae]
MERQETDEPTLPSGHPKPSYRHRPPIQLFPYAYLLLPPLLLAFLTATFLYIHSDVELAMLYSQCHARSRLPFLSRIPVFGAPVCFLVSFFQEALGGLSGSVRAAAVGAEVLASLAGLLSISLIEAARVCNASAPLIAYPTGAWLVFNLVGGAFVWELVVVPAFFRRSQQILAARGSLRAAGAGSGDPEEEAGGEEEDTDLPVTDRHLRVGAEAVAIPVAVTLGYILPSLLLLFLHRSAAVVLVWLFFPLWVLLVRIALRTALIRLSPRLGVAHHLESHPPSLAAVYALPVVLSTAAHVFFLWSLLFGADDRREMTRSALRFFEIDAFFVALTVLYWVAVEAGLEVAGVVLAFSILLGPGAGICIGWYVREQALGGAGAGPPPVVSGAAGGDEGRLGAVENGADGGANGEPGEETPLLR